MAAIPPADLSALAKFVDLCRAKPEILDTPALKFFADFLKEWGATIPLPTKGRVEEVDSDEVLEPPSTASEDEPEIQLDNEKLKDPLVVVDSEEPATFPPLTTLGADDEVQDPEKCAEHKGTASEYASSGEYDKAVEEISKAITMSPPSALMYTRRAEWLLKSKRYLACIRDCEEASKVNPDNGKAYRLRGVCYRFLGEWELAHKNIEQGQRIDYDDSIDEIEKLVQEKYHIVLEFKMSQAIREREKEEAARNAEMEKRRKAREAAAKAAEEAAAAQEEEEDDFGFSNMGGMPNMSGMGGMPNMAGMGGMPNMAGMGGMGGMGGMPNMGGMGGGMPNMSGMGGGMPNMGGMGGMPGNAGGMPNMGNLLSDPELLGMLGNKKVMDAMLKMMQDPAAAEKMAAEDPEVAAAMAKLKSKFGQRT